MDAAAKTMMRGPSKEEVEEGFEVSAVSNAHDERPDETKPRAKSSGCLVRIEGAVLEFRLNAKMA